MEYLTLKKANCRNCHKCIRHCPVKAIRFSGGQAYINQEECILCGTCFVVCPQGAKQIVSEVDRVKEMIRSGETVIASLAPSFISNYEGVGIDSMREALKQLGFAGAEETAIGATLVKREYERMILEEKRDIIITSCCNSINLLIQKYYPSLLGCLADVLSPMQAHCQLIKQQYPNAKTVFVGPCVSKMEEADRYPGLVDAVINFDQLTEWMNEAGISPKKENHRDEESRARFFPTPGGVLRTMDLPGMGYSYTPVSGLESCIMALDEIRMGNIHHCFIEMNACIGSCISGPIMEKFNRNPISNFACIDRCAGPKDFVVDQPLPELLRKRFEVSRGHAPMPSEEEIRQAMRKMGKTSSRDELNCGSCGYNTCREKAIAICQGKAEINMCLPFLMSRNESFSETVFQNMPTALVVTNENLEIQQMNTAAQKLFNLTNAREKMGEDISCLMDPSNVVEVLGTGRGIKERQEYLESCDKYVSETIIYEHNYHILICILRDITNEIKAAQRKEKANAQTVATADRVITNQMRIVQEIACLLGETAAETKVALSHLKESISHE